MKLAVQVVLVVHFLKNLHHSRLVKLKFLLVCHPFVIIFSILDVLSFLDFGDENVILYGSLMDENSDGQIEFRWNCSFLCELYV